MDTTIAMDVPPKRVFPALLECDLGAVPSDILTEVIERNFAPMHLECYDERELRFLEKGMRHALEAFDKASASAGVMERPGWAALLAIEYGCVKDALARFESDSLDMLAG